MRKVINPTQALILGALHSGPLGGAQITAIAAHINGWWNSTRSQVYREMPGLEERGYIKIIRDRAKVPAQYKELYKITAAGKRAYAEWREVTTPPDHLRNPWILRYVLTQYDDHDLAEVCKSAADYYRQARENIEEDQLGQDALSEYYQLMEEWFLRRTR